MTPNYARLASLQTFSKSTRKNNVAYGVLVTNTGNKALNDAFSVVNTDLTGHCLELECITYRHFPPRVNNTAIITA
jgi:hypothetical protein